MRKILLYCTLNNVPSALALATETHIYDCASCAISLPSQILSVIQSLPNLHCSSSHFRELMGKYNLHVKVKRLYEAQMLKMLLQS